MVIDWLPGRTIYQLHSLGAAGVAPVNDDVLRAEPTDHGLRRLEGWLDRVAELGCGAVLLTPIFVASTHGYDIVDPFRIDQRLGGDDDFAAFVGACHGRDLRLVLDGVFNHVGRAFPRFRDVLAHGASSASRDWFHLDFGRDGGDGFDYKSFEGHRELVTLNHRNPEVLDWAVAVTTYWLERGADGWRFDAAYAIPRPFLADVTARTRHAFPDAFLFGEMIHGDYAGLVRETGLDAVTQYELYKAMWSSLRDANFFELAWALKRHRENLPVFAPVTFIGNHDVTRIASQLGETHLVMKAITMLCTMPGVPCVYYGDEFGWQGVKEHRAGGDDAIRPPLPAAPDTTNPIYEHTRALVAWRRERPWLTTAAIEVTDIANRRITYSVHDRAHELRVTLDIDADPGVTIDEAGRRA